MVSNLFRWLINVQCQYLRRQSEKVKHRNITVEKTVKKKKKKACAFVPVCNHSVVTIKWKLVCYPRCQFLTWEGGDKRKRKWREGGDDYSREAIISNIFVKGGDYSKEAINRGTAIIRGNTVLPIFKWTFQSTPGIVEFPLDTEVQCGIFSPRVTKCFPKYKEIYDSFCMSFLSTDWKTRTLTFTYSL